MKIHRMLKRLLLATEATHLSLGVVKLGDALGESWALPIQACLSREVCGVIEACRNLGLILYQSFKNLLFVRDSEHEDCSMNSNYYVSLMEVLSFLQIISSILSRGDLTSLKR